MSWGREERNFLVLMLKCAQKKRRRRWRTSLQIHGLSASLMPWCKVLPVKPGPSKGMGLVQTHAGSSME